jgi:hypothetical protein
MNWPGKGFSEGSIAYWDSFQHEMWRFQIAAQVIAKFIPSFIEFPPMQARASFNAGDLKEKVEAAAAAAKAGGELLKNASPEGTCRGK